MKETYSMKETYNTEGLFCSFHFYLELSLCNFYFILEVQEFC
jgi:hypothetical protein